MTAVCHPITSLHVPTVAICDRGHEHFLTVPVSFPVPPGLQADPPLLTAADDIDHCLLPSDLTHLVEMALKASSSDAVRRGYVMVGF